MKDKAAQIDNKPKNERGSFGRAKTLIKLALLCVIIVMTLSAVSHILDNIARIEAQREVVQAQIAEAEARRLEIEDSVAYVQSIDFIEYMARRMGLVRRDEIIFIMTTE